MAQTTAGSGSGTDITQEAQADTAHAEWVADTRADHEILSNSDDEGYEESQDDSSNLHRRKRKVKRTLLHRKERDREPFWMILTRRQIVTTQTNHKMLSKGEASKSDTTERGKRNARNK